MQFLYSMVLLYIPNVVMLPLNEESYCRTIDMHCMTLTEHNYTVKRIVAIASHTEPTSTAMILD